MIIGSGHHGDAVLASMLPVINFHSVLLGSVHQWRAEAAVLVSEANSINVEI